MGRRPRALWARGDRLLGRAAPGARARGGAGEPPRDARRGQPPRRHDAGRGAPARLLKLGGDRADARSSTATSRACPVVDTLVAGRAPRPAHDAPEPRASPAVALVVLALGIGANTVMFSVVNTLLLRPLPYPDAERLLRVQTVDAERQRLGDRGAGLLRVPVAQPHVRGLGLVLLRARCDLTGGGDPERIRALIVSSDFLAVLRTPPALGRDLLPRDETLGRAIAWRILTDALLAPALRRRSRPSSAAQIMLSARALHGGRRPAAPASRSSASTSRRWCRWRSRPATT